MAPERAARQGKECSRGEASQCREEHTCQGEPKGRQDSGDYEKSCLAKKATHPPIAKCSGQSCHLVFAKDLNTGKDVVRAPR